MRTGGSALQRDDCCSDGADDPSKCNRPWYLDRALDLVGHLERMQAGALTFGAVRGQIDDGLPVGVRIGWDGGGGHFAVVAGWRVTGSGDLYIDVADPIYLTSQVAFDEFPASYQGGGTWSHSYLTAPSGAGGAVVASAVSDSDTVGA